MINKSFAFLLRFVLILFLFIPAQAQLQSLCEFKNVKIPFTFKPGDMIIESGQYDLEFFKHGVGQVFHVKIRKGRKTICVIPEGERINYQNQGNLSLLRQDPEIPEDCRLQIKRNPALKIAYIIFETGKRSAFYPFYKIRFKVPYEDK